jgi:hypothetical protein
MEDPLEILERIIERAGKIEMSQQTTMSLLGKLPAQMEEKVQTFLKTKSDFIKEGNALLGKVPDKLKIQTEERTTWQIESGTKSLLFFFFLTAIIGLFGGWYISNDYKDQLLLEKSRKIEELETGIRKMKINKQFKTVKKYFPEYSE